MDIDNFFSLLQVQEEIKKKKPEPGQLVKSVVTAFSNYITPNCTALIKIMH